MKKLKITQSLITALLFILLGGFGGYYVGARGYEVSLKGNSRKIEIINKEAKNLNSADFSRFWEVWDLINEKHIKRPLDHSKLVEGAIYGMIGAIGDPYTSYFNPVQNSEAFDSLNGLYQGIGAQLGYDDEGRLIIVAPLDGSPAKAAGIMAGDKILSIEGVDTVGISIEQAVSKIRGDAGTTVLLALVRTGKEEPFEIRIVRDTIKLESVIWKDKGDGIVYIRLSRFGEETNQEWSKTVDEIRSQIPKLKGVILDVRDNPGGYLESSVFISSEFIKDGIVVKEASSDGSSQVFKVDHEGLFAGDDLRLVVLINGGSASASEIVAGALKERRQALLVGARSFGKGTVQKSEEFSDGASVHVTVAKWLTPNGNWIDKHNSSFEDSVYNEVVDDEKRVIGGLKPDIGVESTTKDIEAGTDVPLERAIEVLNSNEFFKSSIIKNLIEEIKVIL